MIETDLSREVSVAEFAGLEFQASLARLATALTPATLPCNLAAAEELGRLAATFGE